MQRAAEIESWRDKIYRPAPSHYRLSVALSEDAVRPEATSSSPPILASGAQTQHGLQVPGAPYHQVQMGSVYGLRGPPVPTHRHFAQLQQASQVWQIAAARLYPFPTT